jgi:hypothetical protein
VKGRRGGGGREGTSASSHSRPLPSLPSFPTSCPGGMFSGCDPCSRGSAAKSRFNNSAACPGRATARCNHGAFTFVAASFSHHRDQFRLDEHRYGTSPRSPQRRQQTWRSRRYTVPRSGNDASVSPAFALHYAHSPGSPVCYAQLWSTYCTSTRPVSSSSSSNLSPERLHFDRFHRVQRWTTVPRAWCRDLQRNLEMSALPRCASENANRFRESLRCCERCQRHNRAQP